MKNKTKTHEMDLKHAARTLKLHILNRRAMGEGLGGGAAGLRSG